MTIDNLHLFYWIYVSLPEIGWLGNCFFYMETLVSNVVQRTIAGTTFSVVVYLLVNKGEGFSDIKY